MTEAIKRDIKLELNLAENLPALLLDEKEIKQLLLNLTRNGMEATGQKGAIKIRTSLDSGNVVSLCVTDNGCGISEKNRDRIFDPFFTTKDNGTGLGLAVCASIVRRHNGKIEVLSNGEGTSFIIRFPAWKAE